MSTPAAVDLTPAAAIAAIGALLATLVLAGAWWRQRGRSAGTADRTGAGRLHGLTLLTLFLTFDLVVFGAYTRLSDSGLGCPDWPGCYAAASPLGAHDEIHAAQTALPSGPVTRAKAWVEMVHRYLATAVGALITLLLALAWQQRRQGRRQSAPPAANAGDAPVGWMALCFVWVCAQGAFGALTVTMKLYPAIVTLHLLGGIGLLALLAVAARRGSAAADGRSASGTPVRAHALRPHERALLLTLLLLLIGQVSLGGWVSTNYAVLVCNDFPTCQGHWWPPALDFAAAFTLWHPLGHLPDGRLLGLDALTAIHLAHRLGALVVVLAAALVFWRLKRVLTLPASAWPRRALLALAGLLALQVLTGISNVVLAWPLLTALAHTAGAAALVALLAALLTHTHAPADAAATAGTPLAEAAGSTARPAETAALAPMPQP